MPEPTPVALTGGCQCGAVRYRIESAPAGGIVCHCRMCQKAGGAAFMAFAGVPIGNLVWTRGAPKIFASSDNAERGFCADCGTPLTWRPVGRDRLAVTLGSLDDPKAVAPVAQFAAEATLPWVGRVTELPVRQFSWSDVASRQHPDHDTGSRTGG
jgi:hypothetical protein